MRRWEFSDGSSDKFWEAAVDGSSVQVRFGRSGTQGQSQTRDFDSAELAAAYLAKAISEKERKGYRQSTQAAPEAAAEGSETSKTSEISESSEISEELDEDAFVLPATWRRALQLRRGGVTRSVKAVDKGAVKVVEDRIAAAADRISQAAASPLSEPELVEALAAYRNGEPDPVGAAAAAAIASFSWSDQLAPFADGWVGMHGLVFAARATVELYDTPVEYRDDKIRFVLMRSSTPGRNRSFEERGRVIADRIRALLAVADEETYQEAVIALGKMRKPGRQGVIASYLLPTEQAWAEECCTSFQSASYNDSTPQFMMLCSVTDHAQVAALGWNAQVGYQGLPLDLIATLAEGVGPHFVPLLTNEMTARGRETSAVKQVAAALVELPTDEAFAALLEFSANKYIQAALRGATRRYPKRALRMLAEAALGASAQAMIAKQLLPQHASMYRDLAAAEIPTLSAESAELVASLIAGVAEALPDADPATLPAILVSPPWKRTGKPATPIVIAGMEQLAPASVVWLPGERERWAEMATGEAWWAGRDDHLAWYLESIRSRTAGAGTALTVFALAPEELVRPLLRDWLPDDFWDIEENFRRVAARFELEVLPAALEAARLRPISVAAVLAPFRDPRVAQAMADWLTRLKALRPLAREWFVRHGLDAVPLLIPDALGAPGPERRGAEAALRVIAASYGTAPVVTAAEGYGPQVVEAVTAVLSVDPAEAALPSRLPVLGEWLAIEALPQIPVRAGGALPAEAVKSLIMVLALSRPGEPFPGIEQVKEACDPVGLAQWGWELFSQWRMAGMPAKESWALLALGLLGDDETARKLTPVIRAWPGDNAHHRAVEGLEVLAGIGSDTALRLLHGISQRVPFKALKARAQEKIAEVAEELGLTAEQLGDRLVPDFGLDPDGTSVIDYGPRKFTVGFDEQLRPFVLDEEGKQRKDLPAPGARDDAELAPAARKRFMDLKKDVRSAAAIQLRRLENAMVTQRTWSLEEFRSLFVEHPLIWHLSRRLLWLAGGGAGGSQGGAVTAFRVAEDRTFADVEDGAFKPADDAIIRLAHPLHLGEAVAAWSELFADYEILQPFPQLGREVYRLTEEEAGSHQLTRFGDVTIPTTRILGLVPRGWDRGPVLDNGIECWLSRKVGQACYVVLEPEDGIPVGMPDGVYDQQAVKNVWLAAEPSYFSPRHEYPLKFGGLDPVTASEVLADLTWLISI